MLSSYKKDDETEENNKAGENMVDPTESKVEAAVVKEETPVLNPVNIISFTEWVEKNNSSLGSTSDITRVKISVSDVDSATSIGFKAPNLKGDKDEAGKIKKELYFIKEVSNFSALDLPMFHLKLYKGDLFRIIHQYNERIFIKEYSIKTGSVLVFCTPIDNHLIPYLKTRVKKGDKVISAIEPDIKKITEKMNGTGDVEGLQLMYKQSIKYKDKLTSMKEIADWILKRYEEAIDVNHQIQIDGVLISQVS
jgi:hypothetical protein